MKSCRNALSAVAFIAVPAIASPALAQGVAPNATETPPTAGAPADVVPGGAAPANTAPANEQSENGDIVVTATRQESLLQNTPVAITALSAKTLEQRGVQTLLDIGNYVPNLSIGGRGGAGTYQGTIALRGIGTDAPDSAPSVGIYIDDVYYPSGIGNLLGLFDVQRVEVLRGPQGTLFGRNTIAGAIQYVGVKPSVDSFSGFGFASGGTRNSHELSGAVNVPLGSTFAVRLSVQDRQQGGYVQDRLNGFKRGKDESDQARLQARWQPTDRLTVDLKGDALRMRGNGRPITVGAFNPMFAGAYLTATNPAPLGPPPAGGLGPFAETRPFLPEYVSKPKSYQNAGMDQPDFLRLRYYAGSGIVAYDLTDDITFKSISAYSYTRAHIVNDFDGTPLTIESADRGIDTTRLFTQELQLRGNSFDNRLHWTTGLYYYDSSDKDVGAQNSIGRFFTPPLPTRTIKNRAYAGYAQATFDITGGLSVAAGARYSSETVRAVYPNGEFATSRQRFTDTSPYLGVNWQVNPDTLLYAKASKGFRAGGFRADPNFGANPGDPRFSNGALYFGPEHAWTYEAGARLQFFDRKLRFNPTVFLTNWDDVQFTYFALLNGQPTVGTENAGDARLKGVELETQLQVTPAFQLTGAFSYLDAEYKRLSPALAQSIVLSTADSLPRSPKFKYSFGGRYTIEGNDGSRTVLSADYAWTDKQRSATDRLQAVTEPKYGLLSARIEFTPAGKNFTFAIYGTNLTNKYYLLDGNNFQTNTGTLVQTLGRPRELGASARINF